VSNTPIGVSVKKYYYLILLSGAIGLLIVGMGAFIYKQLTTQIFYQELAKQNEQKQDQEAVNEKSTPSETSTAIVDVTSPVPPPETNNFPPFDASTVLHPFATMLYQGVTGDNTQYNLPLTKTHQAYEKLIAGKVDFIMVTYPSAEEKNMAAQSGVKLNIQPIISDAFVFLVASDNPVTNLTTGQIRGIYTGAITNWREVGGVNAPIEAYQRPSNSGSQTGMLELVMRGTPLMAPTKTERVALMMTSMVEAISFTGGDNNGIGYSYKYYVDTMYQDIDQDVAEGVKILSIDGVAPVQENIQAGNYPFVAQYYFVYDENRANEQTKEILQFIISPTGKKLIEDLGYVAEN
jgi:phosphate transport system substrate-binding protein